MSNLYQVNGRKGRPNPLAVHMYSYPGMTVHQSKDADKKPRDLYFVYDSRTPQASISPLFYIRKTSANSFRVLLALDATRPVCVATSFAAALNWCYKRISIR